MRTDREAQGKAEEPWERQGRSGEQSRLGGRVRGFDRRQGNTQGPSKDPTKLESLKNTCQCPKHTYSRVFTFNNRENALLCCGNRRLHKNELHQQRTFFSLTNQKHPALNDVQRQNHQFIVFSAVRQQRIRKHSKIKL